MPDTPPKPLVTDLKADKAVVVGTVNGNITINSTTSNQYQHVKRKTWRSLSVLGYPTLAPDKDLSTNYPAHLVFQLHRTFREVGYTDFTSVVSISTKTTDDEEVTTIALSSHMARYLGAIDSTLRELWSGRSEARATQDQMNSDLRTLFNTWRVNVDLTAD